MRYTEEEKNQIFEAILEKIENGLSLRKSIIAVNDDFLTAMSTRTFYDWIDAEETGRLAQQYARACDLRHEYLLDEIRDIADDKSQDSITVHKGDYEHEVENKEFINRSKVRIDVRKWELSKLAPKKFGDRVAVDAQVETKAKVTIDYDKLSDEALEEIVNAANYAGNSTKG